MTPRRLLLSAAALLGLAVPAFAPPAFAQNDGAGRRVDQLEKQVRELRAIVFQGRDTGQPVEVRPAGPDPAVVALQSRLDALDDTIRQLKGELEVLTHDADEARQSAAAAREHDGALQARLGDLNDRVNRLEAQLAPAPAAAAGVPPPPSDVPPPPVAAGPTRDATAAAQAADTGRLGGPSSAPNAPPPAAPAARPATAADSYRAARALITSGDYAGASAAFQDYLTRYPTAKNTPEAYYWLGESDYAREDYADATPAYARALKGWPKLAWTPDATVKLARALAESNRAAEACAALTEFDHRYRAAASSTVKARAEAVRTRASCPAA